MRCNEMVFRGHDPFAAIRREFENGLQLRPEPHTARMSVIQDGESFVLSFDLPGVSEDEVSVVFEDGLLTISGSRSGTTPEGAKELFNNRAFGDFRRTLKIDESIDPESIDAVLENGVLAVRLTRRPELQPRKISVRAAQ